ncbi:MAG: futalosine hydrolase [Planctomycetota bacterium]|jgi:futalosine hydrolase
MRVLVMTSVPAEAEAIGSLRDAAVIVGGIGRTNAAAATTEAILRSAEAHGAGFGGSLPDSALALGEAVVASSCIYAEEGLAAPAGFLDMTGLGFSLGDFEGNTVPVDERLLQRLERRYRAGPIATVATCSGTDASAREVVRRTGAIAEAMEGAAVVHAARRLGVAAIELRVISNTTGDRDRQQWDLPGALKVLGAEVQMVLAALSKSPQR